MFESMKVEQFDRGKPLTVLLYWNFSRINLTDYGVGFISSIYLTRIILCHFDMKTLREEQRSWRALRYQIGAI